MSNQPMFTCNEPIYPAELDRILNEMLDESDGELDEIEVDEDYEEDLDNSDADPEYQPDVEENVEDLLLNQIRNVEQEEGPRSTKKQKKSKSITPRSDGTDKPEIVQTEYDTLTGKNGFIWKTSSNHNSGKTKAKNIVHINPGPTANSRQASEPIECFKLFFSDDLLNEVKVHTNEEISRQREKYCRIEGTLQELCSEELDAFLGLLILAAALKDNHLSTTRMFDTTYCGERYHATMSERRFNFIVNCLRFDDKSTRNDRLKNNKLAAVSNIWEILLNNCRTRYKPSSYVAIDEQLVGFRGRCPFRMYIPSKPNKYGIKIIMMCDNNTKYMIDARPYLGKGTVPKGETAADFFVQELVKPIAQTNRNVTMDNWFMTIPLVEKMLAEKNLTVVGTIRANKKEFPTEFTDVRFKNRKIGSTMFLFADEITAVSYKRKENKLVLLVSSMHNEDSVNSITKKPEIIMTYNGTKGAVDTFDQMCQNMNCGRKTKRWPLCYYYNMLNIAVINAYVIYVHNYFRNNGYETRPLSRSQFMLKLHEQLTVQWLTRRMQIPQISRDLKNSILRVLGKKKHAVELLPNQQGPRKYCSFCDSKKKRMTTTYCDCGNAICGEHQKKSCPNCS